MGVIVVKQFYFRLLILWLERHGEKVLEFWIWIQYKSSLIYKVCLRVCVCMSFYSLFMCTFFSCSWPYLACSILTPKNGHE